MARQISARQGVPKRDRQAHAPEPRAGYILIIDDSPAIRSLLKTLLGEIEGYDVRAAASVREALRAASAQAGEAPALILLDLRLPDESTAESVRRLRGRDDWAAAPLVISSGHQQIAVFARELRADAYLPKPFELDAVSALARRYVVPLASQPPTPYAPTQRNPADPTGSVAIPVELLPVEVDGCDDIVPYGR